MKSSERSVSVWETTNPQPEFPALRGEAEADVCVVGAGLAGMTTAYLLAREGKKVIVLDDNGVGGGETGQTTAHLASAQDDYYHVLEKVHGEESAKLIYQSHQAAVDRIGEIATAEGIECDYQHLDGYFFLAPNETPDFLQTEMEAARRAGATVEIVEKLPVPFDSGPGLRFSRQGEFHPLKYLEGLARCIQRDGGRIHTGNHVLEVEGGSTAAARGEGFEVRAGAVVVATNSPINDRLTIHTKQAPYRTYVIGARVPIGAVPHGLYWDTLEHYHYVRVARIPGDLTHEMLVVGGEDHKTGHENDMQLRFDRLEAWTRERFPIEQVTLRWSGQVMEPMDFIGFIGRDPGGQKNVYIATGDSGQGMTHSTIAGILISDLVLGRPNPWEKLYDPKRKTISKDSIMEFTMENVDVAVQYTDLLPLGGDVKSADEIAPGSGAVLQRGLHKVAAYRDEDGKLHEHSAICTHLGCVVQWNGLERSWDCPCHGSRFATDGAVLNGPAPHPLKKLEGE
jgi:glycine/D-amino acid oxidase-like deaminating enzyme/nitrite reductase/ring-hydroxylating ferredoxin subunit